MSCRTCAHSTAAALASCYQDGTPTIATSAVCTIKDSNLSFSNTSLTMSGSISECRLDQAKANTLFFVDKVDASDGCRNNIGVPYIYRACYDWSKRRAHYYAEGQPKRCMKEWFYSYKVCSPNLHCHYHDWYDVPCNWRTGDVRNTTAGALEQGGKNVTFTA